MAKSTKTGFKHVLIMTGIINNHGKTTIIQKIARHRSGNLVDKCQHQADWRVVRRCEVTQVQLLLLLQPTPPRLPSRLAQLLERYTWGDYANGTGTL